MNRIYSLIFTAISLSLLIAIFLINNSIEMNVFRGLSIFQYKLSGCISFSLYLAVCILLTWLSSLLFKKFQKQDILNRNIQNIESADGIFLPTYIAYIFVGLSVKGITELCFCFGVLVAICYSAQIYLFNPIFYLLGYRFFFITNSKKQKILLMTKRRILLSESHDFNGVHRINDYTYVE